MFERCKKCIYIIFIIGSFNNIVRCVKHSSQGSRLISYDVGISKAFEKPSIPVHVNEPDGPVRRDIHFYSEQQPVIINVGDVQDMVNVPISQEKAYDILHHIIGKEKAESECAEGPIKTSDIEPIQGLFNKDLNNEQKVTTPPFGWVYPEGSLKYDRTKTVEIVQRPMDEDRLQKSNRNFVDDKRALLKDVLGFSSFLEQSSSNKEPAVPLEPDIDPSDIDLSMPLPTNPNGEVVIIPSEQPTTLQHNVSLVQ